MVSAILHKCTLWWTQQQNNNPLAPWHIHPLFQVVDHLVAAVANLSTSIWQHPPTNEMPQILPHQWHSTWLCDHIVINPTTQPPNFTHSCAPLFLSITLATLTPPPLTRIKPKQQCKQWVCTDEMSQKWKQWSWGKKCGQSNKDNDNKRNN